MFALPSLSHSLYVRSLGCHFPAFPLHQTGALLSRAQFWLGLALYAAPVAVLRAPRLVWRQDTTPRHGRLVMLTKE